MLAVLQYGCASPPDLAPLATLAQHCDTPGFRLVVLRTTLLLARRALRSIGFFSVERSEAVLATVFFCSSCFA
jgi:hypothetical protein